MLARTWTGYGGLFVVIKGPIGRYFLSKNPKFSGHAADDFLRGVFIRGTGEGRAMTPVWRKRICALLRDNWKQCTVCFFFQIHF